MGCIFLSFVLCVDLPVFVPYCLKKERKKKKEKNKDNRVLTEQKVILSSQPDLKHPQKLEFCPRKR